MCVWIDIDAIKHDSKFVLMHVDRSNIQLSINCVGLYDDRTDKHGGPEEILGEGAILVGSVGHVCLGEVGIYNPDPCITPTGCLADVDGYSSTDHYLRDKNNGTAEVRFVSQLDANIFEGTTSWVAGIYAKQEEEN